MNIETGEVRDYEKLSKEEVASGNWIPLPKKYVKKVPLTAEDHAAVLRAHIKRVERAERDIRNGIANLPEAK